MDKFFLISFIVGTFITLCNIFVFITVKKHKKYYFYYVSFGAGFKLNMYTLVIAVSKKNNAPKSIILVKKNRGFKKLVDLTKSKPLDPKLIKIIFKHIKVPKLVLNVTLGTSDAKNTALICGNIQMLFGAFLAWAYKTHKFKNTVLTVYPDFKKAHVHIFLQCILKLNLVNIIIDLIKRKIKKAVKNNASNREYNAGNYERNQENS